MKTSFIPIDYEAFDFNDKNFVRIIGRNEKGKRICLIDSLESYFWVILKDGISKSKIEEIQKKIGKIEIDNPNRKTIVEKTIVLEKNYMGKKVNAIQVWITNYKDAHDVADKIDFSDVDKRRGYDISMITKYIMDKKIFPLNWYEVEGEIETNDLEVDLCIKLEKVKKIEEIEFKPRILAYDIEASEFEAEKGEILMISLYGNAYKKVLTWKKCSKKQDFVECFKSEEEMIKQFIKYVKDYSPDLLVGYFSDGFDLPYLRGRAEANKIKLDLGLDGKQPVFSRGRLVSGKISGIVHIDLYRFIETAYSQYLQSETLSLDEVAGELLGDKKKEFDFSKLVGMKEDDWREFFEYNLHDSYLTYALSEKLWNDLFEFSRIIKEPLFDVTRDGMSSNVENHILHNLERFNEIPEKRPIHDEIEKRRAMPKYEGAFVFQPIPGLYEKIAFFDFTSMYSSVIVSYNLSLSTFSEKREKDFLEVDLGKEGHAYFSKDKGFFATLLEEIIEKRKKCKKEYNERPSPILKARSNAYKLLANASYGYQGFFGARYYCRPAAASAAALARKSIIETIDKITKAGHKVIYGDSVGGETRVILKKQGKIIEEPIERIFEKIDNSTLGKEYDFKKDIEILTLDNFGKSVFKPIKYVMRHKTNKKMFRINFTNNWNIDVTEDHSLMGYQSFKFNESKANKENPLRRIIEIKPEEIKKKVNTLISLGKIPCENFESNNLPKEVYEFMGYFVGDGSFIRNKAHQKDNKDYYLRLSLGVDKKEVFDRLITPLMNQGYIKSYWWSKTRKGDITINGLKLIQLFSKDFRDKNNKKTIPDWMFYEKEENIASFLRGLFSADGCVIIRNQAPIIKYTSIEDSYIDKVRKLLYRTGISHSVFKENSVNKYKTRDKTFCNGTYSKNIILKNKEDFAEKIGFILERKNKLANIKTRGLQKKAIKDFEFDLQSVKSIEQIKTPKYVYDIEVEENHKFFANYILVHNTDSIAFLYEDKKETLNLLKEINSKLPGIMELDLENFFSRGIFVLKKTKTEGTEAGAKKKYALIDEKGKMKIRGFETVRRDWCPLVRKLQSSVLESVLKEGNEKKAVEMIKDIIKKIKERKIGKEEIMIRTQLKKPLSEYKSITPHVIAAQKIKDAGMPLKIGMLLEYFIAETREKKALVREKVKLPDEKGEYNIDYYLNNQLIPSVENILEVFGVKIQDIVDGSSQKKLF